MNNLGTIGLLHLIEVIYISNLIQVNLDIFEITSLCIKPLNSKCFSKQVAQEVQRNQKQ